MTLEVGSPQLQMPHMGGIDLPSSPPRYESSCGPYRQRSPEACVQGVAPMTHAGRGPTQSMQSPPQVGSASLEGFNKRKAAAEWIEQISGVSVAYETDQAFRAALRDGVVLCSLVDAVSPGSAGKVSDLGLLFVDGCSPTNMTGLQCSGPVYFTINACICCHSPSQPCSCQQHSPRATNHPPLPAGGSPQPPLHPG